MGTVYMVTAALFWTGCAFVYRWAERRRVNRLSMSAAMGLVAAFWVFLHASLAGIDLHQAHPSQFVIGCCQGVLMVAGIPLFLAAVARGDLSVTWTVMTLSFGLTSVMVMIFPGERPTLPGVTGLVLAAAAVALLGLDMAQRHRENGPRKPRKGWGFFMSVSFLTNACALYAYSLAVAFQPDAAMAHRSLFLLTMYGVFGTGSLLLAPFIMRRGSVRAGALMGSVAGTIFFCASFLTLLALAVEKVPGYILYPVTSGGSNLFVVVLSVLFLAERPGPFGWTGIVTGTAALVLLGVAA